jgi:hypothetical protein
MKSVDQIARGVANFYDSEVRPSLSSGKGILYGIAVGRIAANAPNLIAQYAPILTPLGILQDNMVDVEGLAAELRSQMAKSGGQLSMTIMGDTFTFKPNDVDSLVRYIERA